MNNALNGPVYAKVSDNKDPDELGRIKVSFDFLGETMESDWLDVLNIYGGPFSIPEVDSMVVVAFYGGSLCKGIVLGNVWTSNIKPPDPDEKGSKKWEVDKDNILRYFITKGGNKIILNDKDGEEKIQIVNADGKNRLEFLSDDKVIKIIAKDKIFIDAGTNIALNAKEGVLKIKKDLKIKAEEISIQTDDKMKTNAKKNIKLEGNSVTLN